MMQADEPAIPSRLDDSLLEGEEEEDVDGDGRALSEPSHSKREGLTCREACFRARVRCQRIASPGDVVRYLVDHSAIIGFLAVLLSLGALLFFGTLFPYEPTSVSYRNASIPVLHGFDVVAYFSLGKWSHGVKGRPHLAVPFYVYNDTRDQTMYTYVFWFASEINRDAFLRTPSRFLPRFGGFSAIKLATESFWEQLPDPRSHGWHAPPVHPDAFIIYDGHLYMDFSLEHKRSFMQSPRAYIAAAERKWMHWYGSLDAGPLNNFAVRGVFSEGDDSDSSDQSTIARKIIV